MIVLVPVKSFLSEKYFRPENANEAFEQDLVAVKVIRGVKRYVESARIEAGYLEDITEAFSSLTTLIKRNDIKHKGRVVEELEILRDEYRERQDSWCMRLFSHFSWRNHYCLGKLFVSYVFLSRLFS